MSKKRQAVNPTPANKRANNSLRIIGGQWRGRKLSFPDSDGLRPTGDRIRETLFNWLQLDIAGANCLDLFAGAGALGFEAASRGASEVTMIERSAAVAAQLRLNEQLVESKNTEVVHVDALLWLQRTIASEHNSYDILFLDPPFASELLQQSLDLLAESDLLKANALIYIETAKRTPMRVPTSWLQLKTKTTGQVHYYLYRVSDTTVDN